MEGRSLIRPLSAYLLWIVSSGQTNQIDDDTDAASFDWSPDSSKLAFVSYRNGNGEVFVLDLQTQVQTRLTDLRQR